MLETITNKRAAYMLKGMRCPWCYNPLKIDTLFPEAAFAGFSNEPGYCTCNRWTLKVMEQIKAFAESAITEYQFQTWADNYRGSKAAIFVSSDPRNNPLQKTFVTGVEVFGDNGIKFTLTVGVCNWKYQDRMIRDKDFERIDRAIPPTDYLNRPMFAK